MHLTELKNTPVSELVRIGEEQMGLENLARLRKQDIIFAILKQHAKSGEDIFGQGVLEILPDGFGFLRSADSSYLAGPDDIYVDATHISQNSRNKTLDRLDLRNATIIPVYLNTSLEKTIEQNELRSGRSYVPKSVVCRMSSQMTPPTMNEKYKYKEVKTIE